MNIFRIIGDLSHLLSKCILIFAIHINRSAEGVSLITQCLYALVFCARYTDLFYANPAASYWNFILKIIYITTSFYIIFLMLRVYARTREREAAWRLGAYCLVGTLVVAPLMNLALQNEYNHGFLQMLYDFSLVLESVCVLPQLLLLRQTTVPTVIDSFYLVALGSYRAFYILNWIEREMDDPNKPNAVSVSCGVLQTILYADFAWVYWSRQRVKLRAGGVVDHDDLSRGWLLGKLIGRPAVSGGDEEDNGDEAARGLVDGVYDGEAGAASVKRGRVSGWGKKGISVRADDGVLEDERERQNESFSPFDAVDAPDAKMKDPDELAKVLEEDDDDDDEGAPPASSSSRVDGASAGVSGGEEWRK